MIKRFSPFLDVETFGDCTYRFVFKCPCCGFDSCIKLDDLDKFVFWSGQYKCSKCGAKEFNGYVFNFYNDCFIPIYEPVQLSLFD